MRSVNEITEMIIDACICVHKKFGSGLLESVYEKILMVELQKRGLVVECQKSLPVVYEGVRFEDAYRIDLLVNNEVVVEQYIEGREFSVGVMDGKALPVIEIAPKQGFYDYKNKYQAGLTEHICPANFTDEQTSRAKETAQKIFTALRMEQYGRIDMIYTPDTDEFWFIEGNNLPGMTNTSLLPEAAGVMGIKYEDLCEMLALRREQ